MRLRPSLCMSATKEENQNGDYQCGQFEHFLFSLPLSSYLDFRTCPLSRNLLCSLTNIGFETQEVDRLTKDAIGHDLIEVLWPAVVLAHPVPGQFQDAHERLQVAQVLHLFAAGLEEIGLAVAGFSRLTLKPL